MQRLVKLAEQLGREMNTKKVRIQFDFTPEAAERLDELVLESGSASRAELLRNALKLYDELTQEKKVRDAHLVIRYPKSDGEWIDERIRF